MRLPVRLHLTNLLLAGGIGALGLSFALPYVTAARVARIEGRASEIVAILADALPRPGLLDGSDDGAARARLLADVRERGEAAGHPAAWLLDPVPHPARDRTVFSCKHYLFLVARTPPPALVETPLGERPLEIWGWPLAADGSAQSVFLLRDGQAFYCRNLNGRYVGHDRMPVPGAGAPRKRPDPDAHWYWGLDGERWLECILPAPPAATGEVGPR